MSIMTRSDGQLIRFRIVREPMLEDRGKLRIDHVHKCRRMPARPERVFRDEVIHAVGSLALDVELSIAKRIMPGNITKLGVGDLGSVQLTR